MRERKQHKGAVLVELALLSPILVLLVLGAIHFGYLFYVYNQLEKSVREGARYGASRTFVDEASYRDVVRDVVVCGSVGGCVSGNGGVVPGLTPATKNWVSVELIPPPAPGLRPERIRVGINGYLYQGVLGWLVGPLTLSKPTIEMPFFGRFAMGSSGGGGGGGGKNK